VISFRTMTRGDMDFAASCAAAEGWVTETREEFEGFRAYDPNGCFVVEQAGDPIGIGVATGYGEYGFVGELIVLSDFRGAGVGRQLLDHAVSYLKNRGARHILLDGVNPAVSLYQRAGFRKICRSLRFAGKPGGSPHRRVRPMVQEDLERVVRLDRAAFTADRAFFLQRRFLLYAELSMVIEQDKTVRGYIFGRRRPGLIWAGPWYVESEVNDPEHLLQAFAHECAGSEIGLGVLESNERAVLLIRSLGLSERLNPPWRMILGTSDRLGHSNNLYAIGSAAKG